MMNIGLWTPTLAAEIIDHVVELTVYGLPLHVRWPLRSVLAGH